MFDNNPFREYKKMIKELNIPDEVQREREEEFRQAAITPEERKEEARKREEAAKKREQIEADEEKRKALELEREATLARNLGITVEELRDRREQQEVLERDIQADKGHEPNVR